MSARPSRRMQGVLAGLSVAAIAGTALTSLSASAAAAPTTTPIKHVVVIFQENVSYDHYFATYPSATNADGTHFAHMGPVPFNHNLVTDKNASGGSLLTANPNAAQPVRLGGLSQQITCDQDHDYRPEQLAYNPDATTGVAKMDKFVENTTRDTCTPSSVYGAPGLVMAYYDGNSVTGLWNYANRFSMSDNAYSDVFGPSTPGALSLVSGQTHGFTTYSSAAGASTDPATAVTATPQANGSDVVSPDANGVGTVQNDPQPAFDDCTSRNRVGTTDSAHKNIGDLLNAAGVTWGFFQGGFKPSQAYQPANGSVAAVPAQCKTAHNIGEAVGGTGAFGGHPYGTKLDYIPHHEPFQYYASTANPHHLPPTSVAAIGTTDQANHQYDITDFDRALGHGNLPAVSYLKAAGYQDGHAAYSDPIDEQEFLVHEVNAIEQSPFWSSTAIVIAYDDSDGWYDHVAAGVTNSSNDTTAAYQTEQSDAAWCLNANAKSVPMLNGYSDRCGPGMRQPLLVLSPYSKENYVDHTQTTQSSILKFIEDNWSLGRIGDGSFDATAGSLRGMFDFAHPIAAPMILNANGAPQWQNSLAYQQLPAATVGKAYSVIRSVHGAMSVKWIKGTVPPGLTFTKVGTSGFKVSGKATRLSARSFEVAFVGPGWTKWIWFSLNSVR